MSRRTRTRSYRSSRLLGSSAVGNALAAAIPANVARGTRSSGRAQTQPSQRGVLRHPRQPVDARAARQPQQECLRLIFPVVPGDDRIETRIPGRLGKTAVASLARPILQVAATFSRGRSHNAAWHPSAAAFRATRAASAAASGPQTVIHRHDERRRMAVPACDKNHQRRRIRPAGHSEDQAICLSKPTGQERRIRNRFSSQRGFPPRRPGSAAPPRPADICG
jgi:hypothetical protein